MTTPTYEAARRIVASLTREEQLRLIGEIASHADSAAGSASVMELCGLGRELWRDIDAQEYVSRERSSWNG
jgi:hypothetical protein